MRAAFHTLGCKTNAYETQAVMEQFREAGFEICDFSMPCDVYVINTCAVTQEASRKSRQITGRCKKSNPDSLVVVTGCYAQEDGRAILDASKADIVVGNSDKSKILTFVMEALKHRQEPDYPGTGELLVRDLSGCRTYEEQIISGQGDHIRAYVKIQDGCDRFCSYCIIPYLRGRSRSRSMQDILCEVQGLSDRGFQEVVLTGIDISSFQDTSADNGNSEPALEELVFRLSEISGIKRIRLGSLEAGIVSESLVKQLKHIPAFCPQFHLSLQSGSDSVLKRMNRHYTTGEFADSVSMIREIFPNPAITTDIITGFPGETEEEFAETVRFAKQVAFSRLHVFPYSRRKHTRADQMQGQLTKAVREKRAKELIFVGEELKMQYETQLIGVPCTILAEETLLMDSELYVAGYTDTYVRILAPLKEFSADNSCINQFLTVIPKEYRDGLLYAHAMAVE